MAKQQRAYLQLIEGPQEGDAIALIPGTCRLIGRHLSDGETVALDQHGQRIVHQGGVALITNYLKSVQGKSDAATAPAVSIVRGPDPRQQDPDITGNGTFARGADVIVGDEAISRAHAMFYYDADHVMGVVDLGSRNGTRVNGKSITTSLLREGDEVALGSSLVRITFKDS